MADMMTFPETWEEFEKSYGFDDSDEVYTNGSRLIPSFRVKQWLDHIAHLESKRQATVSSDCIIRQDAKDVVDMELDTIDHVPEWVYDRLLTALDKVPSAQPEPTCINLNEHIKVKLTDWGKEIYYHQYDRINQIAGREICKPRFPREDENGYTEFQLWCFIELYGKHMGMTRPNVIEPLEIVYER